MDIALCCASHSQAILDDNLARSPCVVDGTLPLHVERDAPSASIAYNRALDGTDRRWVVFAHHDVFLPLGWDGLLRARLAELPDDWALFGSFGVGLDGTNVGPVWSSSLGHIVGRVATVPVEVQSFDELLIVVDRASGLRFDETLPGWHFYGTDIVASARAGGKRAFAGGLPVVHNDRYHEELGSDFAECYRHLQRKWRHMLPLRSPITKISRSGLQLWRDTASARRSHDVRAAMAVGTDNDPAFLARRCGWADLALAA